MLLVAASALGAQEPRLTRPADWHIRADRPDADTTGLYFVGMPPGWHITTGPSVILWNPSTTASGNFRIEMEVFFFRENSRDTEGYGLLFGGRNLDAPGQDYVYVLLRNDGRFTVRHRGGPEVHTITDWTAHEAIARHSGGEGATVKNVMVVETQPETVRVLVNGQELGVYPRSHMNADGIVGLRVNHALNLHVSRLEVLPR